jgi:hypothetical protein
MNGARVDCAQETQQLVSNTRPRRSRTLRGDEARRRARLLRAVVRSQGCSGMSQTAPARRSSWRKRSRSHEGGAML